MKRNKKWKKKNQSITKKNNRTKIINWKQEKNKTTTQKKNDKMKKYAMELTFNVQIGVRAYGKGKGSTILTKQNSKVKGTTMQE